MAYLKKCECGCGQDIPAFDKKHRPRRFVAGHHNRFTVYGESHGKGLVPFKKGNVPWNKGLHPEYIQGENNYFSKNKFSNGKKISKTMKGKIPKNINLLMERGESCRFKVGDTVGEKNSNWKGGVTSENKKERFYFSKLSKKVLKRDDYTCQVCGKRGGDLHVDHIQSWKDFVELRFRLENLRTLCRECHYKFTFNKEMPHKSKWGLYPKYKEDN